MCSSEGVRVGGGNRSGTLLPLRSSASLGERPSWQLPHSAAGVLKEVVGILNLAFHSCFKVQRK